MPASSDSERFAAAKLLPACREALARPVAPPSLGPLIRMLVVNAILIAVLTPLLIAMRDRTMLSILLVPVAISIYLVVLHRRARNAESRNVLAIVGAAGSAAVGDAYAGVSSMSRFLVLRTEDGREKSYSATAMAAAGLSNGDLGVAMVRGGVVVGFAQLQA